MSIVVTPSRNFLYELGRGNIDLSPSGQNRIILMRDGFTFNAASHSTYGDIVASEIDSGGGYARLTKSLESTSGWKITGGHSEIEWDWLMWITEEPGIEEFSAAVLLHYVSGSLGYNSIVIGCVDFGETINVPISAAFRLDKLGLTISEE